MDGTAWFFVITAAAIVLTIIISWLSKQGLTPKCPECESKDVVEIGRESIGSRSIENIGSGTPAGGNIRLQLDIEISYRCQSCQHTFKRQISETQ